MGEGLRVLCPKKKLKQSGFQRINKKLKPGQTGEQQQNSTVCEVDPHGECSGFPSRDLPEYSALVFTHEQELADTGGRM